MSIYSTIVDEMKQLKPELFKNEAKIWLNEGQTLSPVF